MMTYIFTPSGAHSPPEDDRLHGVLYAVASGTHTDTSDLVIALYLLKGRRQVRGTAYARAWMAPDQFTTSRGHWSITRRWAVPDDLPDRYKLIRMRMDGSDAYPRTETDRYGWRFTYERFVDHLAALFAHELHHFRRYHLGLHSREGENAANRWALNQARSLGYRVEGRKIPTAKKRPSNRFRRIRRYPHLDPYRKFRSVKAGDSLIITKDPQNRYAGSVVKAERPIRSNSKRLVICTPDGKSWRWPMEWLDIANPE